MTKVYVVEGDNNQHYSDHMNWFIAVAANLEAAKTQILKQMTEYFPVTPEPVEENKGSFQYKWDFEYNQDADFDYYQGNLVSVYIHLENILEENG